MARKKNPVFEILPGVGVGPVKLAMTRGQVFTVLLPYEDIATSEDMDPTTDYAFGNSLQIEYGRDGTVQFIGIGYYTNCGCEYMFQDRAIGTYSAKELFELLAKLDGGKHRYDSNEYFFPKIMMTVWEADDQYDYVGGHKKPVYGQVGVANQQYIDAIS